MLSFFTLYLLSLLNSVGGVGSVGAWVCGWRGPNFGLGGVGLRCFVKKVLLKVSINLQENTCGGVSS